MARLCFLRRGRGEEGAWAMRVQRAHSLLLLALASLAGAAEQSVPSACSRRVPTCVCERGSHSRAPAPRPHTLPHS